MRYTPLVACLAILCSLTGCEPKAIDPDSGRELSAPEWAAQTERVRRQADADVQAAIANAKRESDRMTAEAAAAEQLAAANAAKTKRAFERAVARLQTETALRVDDLAAEFDAAQADAALSLRSTLDAFAQRTAEIQAQADDRIATNRLAVESANAKAQTALDEIAAKQERLASILSAGQSVAGSFGPGGMAIASLIGIGGSIFGVGQRNKAKRTENAAARIVDAIDVVKEANPVFAQAFKQHAKKLSEWMGPDGIALVNKAQHS